MFVDFRERKAEKEREREALMREKHQSVVSHMCPNQDGTHKLLIYGTTLQPAESLRQGVCYIS